MEVLGPTLRKFIISSEVKKEIERYISERKTGNAKPIMAKMKGWEMVLATSGRRE